MSSTIPQEEKIQRVSLVQHDPQWSAAFQSAADTLQAIFGNEIAAIHHVGSTAIPTIKAKPILDILIEFCDRSVVPSFIPALEQHGYRAWGENGIPGRSFFTKAVGTTRLQNVHGFERGHPEIERMLLLRDYLREHPQAAQAYDRLKEELAQRFPTDIDSYAAGKSAFVAALLEQARQWRAAQ